MMLLEVSMLEYDLSFKKIKINLNNKIYILGQDSAEGKSYLFSLLKSLKQRPENRHDIYLVTYSEELDIEKVIFDLEEFNGKLVMLDRADLYWCTNLGNALKNLSDLIVLLDLKSNDYIMQLPANPLKLTISRDLVRLDKYAIDV